VLRYDCKLGQGGQMAYFHSSDHPSQSECANQCKQFNGTSEISGQKLICLAFDYQITNDANSCRLYNTQYHRASPGQNLRRFCKKSKNCFFFVFFKSQNPNEGWCRFFGKNYQISPMQPHNLKNGILIFVSI
jgi:hypothetical protein